MLGFPCSCPILKGNYGKTDMVLNLQSPIKVPKGNIV